MILGYFFNSLQSPLLASHCTVPVAFITCSPSSDHVTCVVPCVKESLILHVLFDIIMIISL